MYNLAIFSRLYHKSCQCKNTLTTFLCIGTHDLCIRKWSNDGSKIGRFFLNQLLYDINFAGSLAESSQNAQGSGIAQTKKDRFPR